MKQMGVKPMLPITEYSGEGTRVLRTSTDGLVASGPGDIVTEVGDPPSKIADRLPGQPFIRIDYLLLPGHLAAIVGDGHGIENSSELAAGEFAS
ncbi:hypothetical protein FGG08_000789 [Glutinoglossum americanum]|uniref:Uncharacterized protein n=1 Tax=Glutinoglossum americanum TaxID=1670608 RepID=A0A9P8I9P0_9PEZI|nr:hypothetical protein FGG08_000789 [Glutinoglossum americanum]